MKQNKQQNKLLEAVLVKHFMTPHEIALRELPHALDIFQIRIILQTNPDLRCHAFATRYIRCKIKIRLHLHTTPSSALSYRQCAAPRRLSTPYRATTHPPL